MCKGNTFILIGMPLKHKLFYLNTDCSDLTDIIIRVIGYAELKVRVRFLIRFIRYIRVRKASPTSALNQGKTKTFSLPEEAKRGVKSALLLSHFPQFVRLFCPKSPFFANSWKKVSRTFGQFVKRSYLCTRFPKRRARNSIFDRLRTVQKTSSARIYIICMCTSNKVIPFDREIQTNNGAGKPGRSDRTINIIITVKSLILAQDER